MTLRDPSLTDLRRVAVFGLGRSGVAAANLLVDLGVDVLASAPSEPASLEALRDGVAVHIGGNVFAGCDLVVASPGIPPSARVFEDVRATGVSVWSEVELAWRATKAPFLGISGTDGKTTTTSVLGAMIEAWGERPSRVAGNIGTPLSEVALDLPDDGVVVAELSAFQLWSTARFRPHVAGLTNIAPD
ncbi:MAG: UDP-N-acetylmuramoyl-L-alanine--D-glutamate ligase, partial [Myxococcota bacterium]